MDCSIYSWYITDYATVDNMNGYMYVGMYASVYVYVCMYVCMYACMYVCCMYVSI